MHSASSPHSLFISDLHLCSSRPAITALFLDFLSSTALQADALYVLGDLFEYWAGDDDLDDPHHQAVIMAFQQLHSAGTITYFIHGNRDFLIGARFAAASGMTLLTDPYALTLYGHNIVLSHGDALCTDDTDYQKFRQQVRTADWQTGFLGLPLTTRKAQIEALRQRSEQEKSHKSMQIMDVNGDAVDALLRTQDYPALLIHGHTHRPGHHTLVVDGRQCERWVLGDWYEQGSCLRLDATGCLPLPVSPG